MAQKQDLRIRKTHKFLYAALFDLMAQKPFNEISVTDICQKAMVHRTTFYNHFEDKYHLLRCAIESMQEEFISQISRSDEPHAFYLAMIDQILDHLYENRLAYSRILRANRGRDITRVFHKNIVQLLLDDFNHFPKSSLRHPAEIPTEALAEFYTGAFFSLASWWLEHDTSIPKEDLRRYVHELLPLANQKS